MRIYDVLWKREERNGRTRWEKVGVLIEKDNGKMSLKIDALPASCFERLGRLVSGITKKDQK